MKKALILNSGSATLKFRIFNTSSLKEEVVGIVERIGIKKSFLEIEFKGKKQDICQNFRRGIKNHQIAFEILIDNLKEILPDIELVGHRVVHGGDSFIKPTKLNLSVIKKLEKYNKFAPLHNPVNLMVAKAALKFVSKADHFAVFDTGYYSSIPDYARLYALPKKYALKYGIKRYGFHGISHAYAASVGAKKIKKPVNKLKIITCHLGSGSSITATKFGKAIDTTMGFTPLEGLTMSTRAGDLDASIPLFMIDQLKMSVTQITKLFNEQSGLLGIADTMDMREILSAAGKRVVGYRVDKKINQKQKKSAKLALNMFVYDIVRYIGQFVAIMNGVDLIVFTGGIGERSPVIRNLILNQVKHLGNFKSVMVTANEELMIARQIIKS